MQTRILLLLIALNFSFTISAQEYVTSVRHFTEEEGWETRDFRMIFKDSQGFMWFTSEVGAYRFDGYHFKNFKRKTKNNDSYSLAKIGEDSERNIWFEQPISEDENIDYSILPFGTDTLIRFDYFLKDKLPFDRSQIAKIIFGKDNLFWFVNIDGKIFEYRNQSFKEIFQIPSSPNISFTKEGFRKITIEKISDNSYWIRVQEDFFKVSNHKIISKKTIPLEKHIQLIKHEPLIYSINFLHQIFLSDIDQPRVNAIESILSAHQNSVFLHHNFNGNPNYMLVSKSDSIYDLELFDIEENIRIDIEPFGIPNQNISPRSFFVENKNSIWLTTHDGIYNIQLNKQRFENYLSGIATRAMMKLNNHLWVTSNKGFHKINLKTKTIEDHTEEEWRFGRGLFLENQNELWMGKLYGGISKINPTQMDIIKAYPLYDYLPLPIDINCIHRDKKTNQLWAGTSNQLLKYDEQTDQFLPYPNSSKFKNFEKNNIYQIFENEDLILIASTKGIFQLDPEQGIIAEFSSKNKTLPHDHIVFIHQDKKDNTFWLGTKWNGLIHWDKTNGTSEVFDIESGLVDNLVYAVYEDDADNLWLPSNKGVMRFHKKSNEVTTYTSRDGIPYDEFNYYSHHQDEEGNLYFGGLNGITIFHPSKFPAAKENAPLHLVDIESLDGETLKMNSHLNKFKKNKKLILSPSNNSFRLTFALLDYKYPEKNNFQYKFEGKENVWTKMKGNALQLSNLPYGEYSISVRGQNSNGNWSSQTLNIPLKIQRPFYLKTSFYLFTSLALGGLIWFFIRRRTSNLQKEKEKLEEEVARRTKEIKKQAEELKELDKIKTRFFANVTHELRTPLTLIIGPLKQLMKADHLDDETMRTLTAIAQNSDQLQNLVEEILDLSRYDANKLELNKKSIHFLSEIKKWVMGFDLEAQQRGIQFEIYYQLPIDMHLLIDSRKLKKIITNLLSNAFKHTKNGDQITLEVLEKNEKIQLKVVDTGEGIHSNDLPYVFDRFYQSKQTNTQIQGGLGIGLALSKELAKLMEGNISVNSEMGVGSTFTLEIPKEKGVAEVIQKGNMLEKSRTSKFDALSKEASETDHNILIVEDNIQMQIFIQQLLHPIANTFIANNGKDALQFLENSKDEIDLIISDIMMPEMDGFTLLQRLKSDAKWQLTPVIMLTARGDISDKLNAIRIGVDDYLVKPFNPDELIARVNNLFQLIKLRKPIAVPAYKMDEPELPAIESADLKWLKNLEEIAFENITQPNFSVSQLAFKMTLSERQINRKLKKLTGLTPGNYLKEIKLQKARQLLENKAYSTVSEISYLIGFSTPDYFSKIYKKRFGKSPSEYLN